MLKEETGYIQIIDSNNIIGVNMVWKPISSEFIVGDSINYLIDEYNSKNQTLDYFIDFIYEEDKEKMISIFKCDLEEAYDNNYRLSEQYRLKTKNNSTLKMFFIGNVIRDNKDYYLVGTSYLCSPFKSKYKIINRNMKGLLENKKYSLLSEYDRITNLPNAYYFKEVVSDILEKIKKQNKRAALMVIDLDDFKYINDSFGHEFGDLLLKEVAKSINNIVSSDTVFCRYSGDTFFLFLSDFNDKEDILKLAKDITTVLERPNCVKGNIIYLSSSIGISLFPEHGLDYSTLLKNADAAMYEAKKNGKKKCEFFDDSYGDKVNRIYSLQKGLRTALEKNEIYVVFQPKVSFDDSVVNGFEALVRWNSGEFGQISPGEFIPIAESSKMIIQIGSFVLEEVFKKIKYLLCKGKKDFKIAVNLSEMQLREDVVLADLKRLLKKYKIPSKYIEVEITESMLMKSFEKNLNILDEIRKIGISIALDDFGTGYSSLNYLTKLPIDVLKIDRSFVIDLMTNPKSKCIVENIINLSHQLGIEVVAEGIEEESQVEYLREILCDIGQGYYYSKPRNFEEIINLIGKNI